MIPGNRRFQSGGVREGTDQVAEGTKEPEAPQHPGPQGPEGSRDPETTVTGARVRPVLTRTGAHGSRPGTERRCRACAARLVVGRSTIGSLGRTTVRPGA